jgi:hypothetical protein
VIIAGIGLFSSIIHHYLADNGQGVTFDSDELALIKRKLIVELVLLAILRLKRYFKAFDVCITKVEGAEIDILKDFKDILVALVEHISDQFTVQTNAEGILDEGTGLHTHSQEG